MARLSEPQHREVGIVIPTLGARRSLLLASLQSIRNCGEVHICVVAPKSANFDDLISLGLVNQIVIDPMKGLPAAINVAISQLPSAVKYVNWLGDDDLLTPRSIEIALHHINEQTAEFVFGACEYIDIDGRVIGKNRSGRWAMWLLKYGPDLVPQPGALFSRSAFESVGGLNENLGWAFDLDLFLKFRKSVSWCYTPTRLAQYRWHSETLSTGRRNEMVREARRVRRNQLGLLARIMSPVWEVPTAVAVNFAGTVVNNYSRFRHKNNK